MWIAAVVLVVAIGFAGMNVPANNHVRSMIVFTSGGDRTSKFEAFSVCEKSKVLFAGVNLPCPVANRYISDIVGGVTNSQR